MAGPRLYNARRAGGQSATGIHGPTRRRVYFAQFSVVILRLTAADVAVWCAEMTRQDRGSFVYGAELDALVKKLKR